MTFGFIDYKYLYFLYEGDIPTGCALKNLLIHALNADCKEIKLRKPQGFFVRRPG